ncbi:hypothetical protein NKJ86_14020 [Mesorhizobium sp. M0025]|uniref:hypothetical protein n=1 Tax=Mesorhizobium sp. M0025 TaxID=2956846 RepID=UPI00333E047A
MSKTVLTILFYCYCVAFAAIVLLPTYFDFVDVCPANTGTASCIQTWVSALSGWAAFGGALLAIPFLAAQVSEARRQTEFIVGDALPTASLHDPREVRVAGEEAFSTRLTIVNWNRHPILVRQIDIVEPAEVKIFEVKVEDEPGRQTILQKELANGRMLVPGWVNRGVKPYTAEFDVILTSRDHRPAEDNLFIRGAVKLRIDIVIAGATHRNVRLTAERPDAIVVTQ